MKLILQGQYFTGNDLHLNADKTKLLYFNLYVKDNSGPVVILDEKIIEEVHFTKFLGLIIDKQLTLKQHICRKLSSNIYLIRTVKTFGTVSILQYSLVFPYLNYGIYVWRKSTSNHVKPVKLRLICRPKPNGILQKSI